MTEKTQTKKVISQEEFQKRIEIETQNLMYFEYKDKRKAAEEAKNYIGSKFQVV